MKRKTLDDIITIANVGALSTLGGIKLVKVVYEVGEKIAPQAEKYVGLIGYGAIKYGLPVLVALGAGCVVCTAIKATNNYLSERHPIKFESTLPGK